MKHQGCDIEAKDICYHIPISKTNHPFQIWSKEDEDTPKFTTITPTSNAIEKSSKSLVRTVLKNVSCHARQSEILAIVGPSGAGKSSLLEILAGKLTPPTSPTILVNKTPLDKSHFRKISGFVTQKDTLFPLLTVKETLLFSASLRLGDGADELRSRVDALIQELRLCHVADSRVGDDSRVRGVSGGERRRVSIGVEVVHDPRILILDEPTSGLDSTSALQIVEMLKVMAETRGRTVILSIHQPGYRILKLFGSLLLLADGSVLHHGTVEELHSHLVALGLTLPNHCNVLEFALDSLHVLRRINQSSTPQNCRKGGPLFPVTKRDRCTLQQLFLQHKIVDEESLSDVNTLESLSYSYANSPLGEVVVLTRRNMKNVLRTKQLFAFRTIQMLISSLVLGSLFYKLGEDKIAERVGLFAFILTFLLACTTEGLPVFLQEREIVMKETSSGSYRVSSYVIANALVFLPFLFVLAVVFAMPLYWLVGLNHSIQAFMYFVLLIWLILYTANSVVVFCSAISPNFIVGNSIVSGIMGAFFLFSGYFISKKSMPSYWVFMHYISLFKYPFESFLINEFANKCLKFEFGECLLRADDLLRQEGLEVECRWKNVMMMVSFILLYRLLAYIMLRCRCKCVQKGGLRRAFVL